MGTLAPDQIAPTEQYRAASAHYNDGKYVEALSILNALRAQYPHDQTIAKAIQKCWAASEARDQVIAVRAAHPIKEEESETDDDEPRSHPRMRFAVKVTVFVILAAIPCAVIYKSVRDAWTETRVERTAPTLNVIQSTVQTPGIGAQPLVKPTPIRPTAPQRVLNTPPRATQ